MLRIALIFQVPCAGGASACAGGASAPPVGITLTTTNVLHIFRVEPSASPLIS